ncbi:MAG: DNA repair protein RecN, partial [Planctomycetes bacterium]|nr:DNA repair protein RecN [Planctomycetota bacterium]
LIFDEVDANIGGRTAKTVGDRLAAIARCHQVVCVTHLPQIASCADHQLKIAKQVRNGQTFTVVEELRGDARLHEIAEMIGGKAKTAVSLAQAQEMLESGKEESSGASAGKR